MPRLQYDPKNRYWKNSNLSEDQFLEILSHFCHGTTATEAHKAIGSVSRETIGRYYVAIGERLGFLWHKFSWRTSAQELWGENAVNLTLNTTVGDDQRSENQPKLESAKSSNVFNYMIHQNELAQLAQKYDFVPADMNEIWIRILSCSKRHHGLKGELGKLIIVREAIKWIIEEKLGMPDSAALLRDFLKNHYRVWPGPSPRSYGTWDFEEWLLGPEYAAYRERRHAEMKEMFKDIKRENPDQVHHPKKPDQ